MPRDGAALVAMTMTVSGAFAADGALAPGKPLGTKQAQIETGGVLLVAGIGAVARGDRPWWPRHHGNSTASTAVRLSGTLFGISVGLVQGEDVHFAVEQMACHRFPDRHLGHHDGSACRQAFAHIILNDVTPRVTQRRWA